MHANPPDFYFNGELMPAWGASWSIARLPEFLRDSDTWDEDFGHRDVWITYCRIDHTGTVESSDPELFLYVIQEVAILLLQHAEPILAFLQDQVADPAKVHRHLLDAAFAMRASVLEKGIAFWCSGSEADRQRCLEWMDRSELAKDDVRYLDPPHVVQEKAALDGLLRLQAKTLHRFAQDGRFDRALRKELLRI